MSEDRWIPFVDQSSGKPLQSLCYGPLNGHWFLIFWMETLEQALRDDKLSRHHGTQARLHALCGWKRPNEDKAYPISGDVTCPECLEAQAEKEVELATKLAELGIEDMYEGPRALWTGR